MPMVKPSVEGVSVRRRRLLVNGMTGVGKTTSMLTLPRPIAIVSAPGEKGYDSIPQNDPEVLSFVWQDEPSKETNSDQIIQQVERTCVDLIAGKHGNIQSLVFEGLHKFYEYILDAVTGGEYFDGGKYDNWTMFPRAKRRLTGFLDRLMLNNIPVVAVTVWSEAEPDRGKRPGESASDVQNIPTHIYPALMGKLAKEILGEFSVVVHQSKRKEAIGDKTESYMWQLKPHGDVWGCSIKGPKELTEKLPIYIKADYRELVRVLEEVKG